MPEMFAIIITTISCSSNSNSSDTSICNKNSRTIRLRLEAHDRELRNSSQSTIFLPILEF